MHNDIFKDLPIVIKSPVVCLSPLNDWTKMFNHFCNQINLGYEQSKKTIYT
jgi:hypothetical protein